MTKKEPRVLCRLHEYIKSDLYNKQIRGGVLPYTRLKDEKEKDRLFVCFGVDYQTGDYTDFAGKIEIDEDVITGTLREFYEESRKVFGQIKENEIKNCWCIYDEKNLLIFIPFHDKEDKIIKETVNNFQNKVFLTFEDGKEYNENRAIEWLDEDKLEHFFLKKEHKNKYGVMYEIPHRLISFCLNLTYSMGFFREYLK